jgi:hypoxanthine-DNA glycosylase
MKTAFEPIANDECEVLILGTMPGEMSLKLQQYYAHAGNQFWKIIFKLFNEPLSGNYTQRKEILLKNKIALWDVLSHCEGEGSSDSSIKNEVPNDFNSFYQKHSKIKYVFLTSQKAEKLYDKFIGKSNLRTYLLLPSTSSANTWKTFDEKVNEWSIILKLLNNS